MAVEAIRLAESTYKQQMFDLIEELRSGIESGEVIELIAVKIGTEDRYHVVSAGDVSMVRVAGYLSSAWLSAAMSLRE